MLHCYMHKLHTDIQLMPLLAASGAIRGGSPAHLGFSE